MQVWKTLADWREYRQRAVGRSIGFVPTMGALHHGHGALVERCRRENDIVVVSIFVNPTQFNDPKDLDRYPRTLDADLALLESLGADHVILPTLAEMYPHGYRFKVERNANAERDASKHVPDATTHIMEEAFRPGFLTGVMTVVMKLLNIARADRAYFGEKDYQQLRAVAEMVEDFFIPTVIVPCATIREESGLAASSRNQLLSADARAKAATIYQTLTSSPTAADARTALESNGFKVDYVEEHWGRRFAAAFLDGVRLIDNVRLSDATRGFDAAADAIREAGVKT
jgi:pantoate--beta-alanine ligase